MTSPGAGLDAAKSSMRVNASRTGRSRRTHAAAASGSAIISFPPKAPPSGAARTRTRSCGQPSRSASCWRVLKAPGVLEWTTRPPSGSSHAVATCGSM